MLLVLIGVLGAGCRELLVDPAPAATAVRLALAPGPGIAADEITDAFDAADRIYIRIELPDRSPIEEIRDFDPSVETTTVSVTVPLENDEEQARVIVELRQGSATLFQAVREVVLSAGGNPTIEMPISPVPDHVRIDGPDVLEFASLGESVQLQATVEFAGGQPFPRAGIAWTSSNANVATVTSSGSVTVRSEGVAVIRASYGDLSDEVEVRVEQVVASVAVRPSTAVILVGETVTLSADARDARGNSVVGRVVTWTSTTGAATVDANGVVTGVGPGTSIVRATVGGGVGESVITVEAPLQELFEGFWYGSMLPPPFGEGSYYVEISIQQDGSTASGVVYLVPEASADGGDVGQQADPGLPFSNGFIENDVLFFSVYDEIWESTFHFGLALVDENSLNGDAQECYSYGDVSCQDWFVSLKRSVEVDLPGSTGVAARRED